MKSQYNLGPGDILFLSDGNNTVGAVKAGHTRRVFIETGSEELVQFLEQDDLIAVSSFSGGSHAKDSIACMLYLVREGGLPLLVLPRDHPAIKRLPLVVSAGEQIRLTSCIVPGTHPEQDVLCGRGALDGIMIKGVPGGIAIDGDNKDIAVEARACLFYTNIK